MKNVPIKIQRIMMFIPFLNIFILFVWLYNYRKFKQNKKLFLKSLIIIFVTTIPMVIVRILLEKLFIGFPFVLQILHYGMLYLIPFNMAYGLIRFQEKYALAD